MKTVYCIAWNRLVFVMEITQNLQRELKPNYTVYGGMKIVDNKNQTVYVYVSHKDNLRGAPGEIRLIGDDWPIWARSREVQDLIKMRNHVAKETRGQL